MRPLVKEESSVECSVFELPAVATFLCSFFFEVFCKVERDYFENDVLFKVTPAYWEQRNPSAPIKSRT